MSEDLCARAGRMPGRPRNALFWALALASVLSGAAKTLPAQTGARDFSASQGQVTEDVELEGTLTIAVEDGYQESRRHYLLETEAGNYTLRFGSDPAGFQTGMRVTVKGTRTDGEIAVAPEPDSLKLAAEQAPGATEATSALLGAQNTAVLLVNFANNPVQPFTAASVNNTVFTGTSNFDLENSYGQTWLTGNVFGWYTIAFNLSATSCDFSTMLTVATQAKAAAALAGVNLAPYSRLVYIFPNTSPCSFWGWGTIGGFPSSAWINGDVQVQVVAHEMGHNLGLDHSHSLDCGTAVIGTGCTRSEYGDPFDNMGMSTFHWNAFQKERLGWLNSGSSPPIRTVTATGTYSIDAFETVGSGHKALKILKSGSTYYYVEFRRAIGVDAGLAGNTNVMNGVVIHQASPSDSDSSDLLDMTAADTSFSNPALVVGQSFYDPAAQVTITPVSVGASSASVTVTLGAPPACTRVNPSVTLSPATGAGVASGTAVAFTVSVTNNDSSSCAASTFDLTNTVPSGWTASFSTTALALSPGAGASATMTVTSAASAANGTYPFTATGKNRGATAFSTTASASYVVSNPCARANPSVSLSPATGAGVAAGTAVAFTVSVTNNDSSSCAASTFDLTSTVPSGWTASFSSPNLGLGPGAGASTTMTVTSAASAVNGTYPFNATAKNRGATAYAAAASANYVVSNPTCARANPSVSLSPSTGAGVAAGTAVAFTVSVTNNDNSLCAASTFDLTSSVPSGWTGSFSSTALTLSPGAGGSSTMTVASAASAVNASYPFTATATNRGATAYAATASAGYVVSNPACTRVNPSVSLSPATGAGVAAGTAVAFAVTVTNNDNSLCSASTFDLTSSVPSGWTASFSSTALTLSPGAGGSATITVTSAASAANASYPFNATAKNRGATAFQATASANYVVATPTCARANPSVSLSPATGAGVASGTAVAFTVSVTNNDNSGCSASTFDLTKTVPSGWTASFSATSLALSPGAGGSATMTVTSASSAVNGTYAFSATAKNRGATAFAATASASYVVSSPTCSRVTPLVDLSPATGAGVLSGTPVSYTFSVTNRDGSGCAASTFDLTSTVPSGWAASYSSSPLSLAPGASGTATLQVTSSAAASNGNYTVTAKATNRGATAYSKSDTATYVVANPTCARANPVLSVSPTPSAGVAAGTPVTFNVSVTNNDSAVCVAATFDLTRTMPTGWTAVYGAPSLVLAPGATGQTTLLVTSKTTAVDGSYSVTATAKNRASTSYSASAVATCVVLNAGPTALADDFNRADSTNLGTAWTEGAGNLVVSGGMLKNGPGVVDDVTAVAAAVNGETQSVEADFTSVDNNLGPRFGVMLRYVDSNNYYLIYRQTGGSSRLLISKVVNGVETILKTASISNPAKDVPFHIKGRATGTTLFLDFNGVNKVTITDATFTTGKVGILIGNNSETVQQEADNFNATAD